MRVNLYRSIFQAYIHPTEIVKCSFAEFVEFAQKSQELLEIKENGMLFNLCTFVDNPEPPPVERFNQDLTPWPREQLIRRCRQNISEISALMLDIDGTMTLDQAVAQWCDYEFFVYSTHGNSATKEKFRLIVPLEQPLTAEEFNQRHESMVTTFAVDGASFTMSQAFYLPSYSEHNRDCAFMYWNKSAVRYNAHQLPVVKYQNIATEYQPPTQPTDIAQSIMRTLETGCDLHYVDALPLAILCKGQGIACNDYIALVNRLAAADSQLRQDVDLARLYQQAYTAHMTRRRMTALMEKLHCNMWRWQLTQQNTIK